MAGASSWTAPAPSPHPSLTAGRRATTAAIRSVTTWRTGRAVTAGAGGTDDRPPLHQGSRRLHRLLPGHAVPGARCRSSRHEEDAESDAVGTIRARPLVAGAA